MCNNFNILAIIAIPLGWLMWLCNLTLPVYWLSLLLFTILTRLMLFPLSIKQQKGMAKMAMLRPRLERLQNQYGNNKEKLQQEQMKLYEEIKYNPMSGCLPMILQMLVLFGLINVIYNPLAHVLQMPEPAITELKEKATIVCQAAGEDVNRVGAYDMYVISYHGRAEALVAEGKLEVNPFNEYSEVVTKEIVDRIDNFNMDFFGAFLGDTVPVPWPQQVNVIGEDGQPLLDENGKNVTESTDWNWSWTLLIPLLSGLTSFLTGWLTQKANGAAGQAGGGMKTMLYIMPLFSVWIAFTVPMGVALYWIYSNLTMMVQSWIMRKYWNPDVLAEKMEKEQEELARKKKQAAVVKVQVQTVDGETVTEERSLTQKELDRQRLAEARRRDAEKYGEEYVEVTDDDLK